MISVICRIATHSDLPSFNIMNHAKENEAAVVLFMNCFGSCLSAIGRFMGQMFAFQWYTLVDFSAGLGRRLVPENAVLTKKEKTS